MLVEDVEVGEAKIVEGARVVGQVGQVGLQQLDVAAGAASGEREGEATPDTIAID